MTEQSDVPTSNANNNKQNKSDNNINVHNKVKSTKKSSIKITRLRKRNKIRRGIKRSKKISSISQNDDFVIYPTIKKSGSCDTYCVCNRSESPKILFFKAFEELEFSTESLKKSGFFDEKFFKSS